MMKRRAVILRIPSSFISQILANTLALAVIFREVQKKHHGKKRENIEARRIVKEEDKRRSQKEKL